MINYKQCTIQWYVDGNKVTHGSKDGTTGVIDIKNKHFRALVVSCVNKHTFLVMEIDLVKDGKIKIAIKSYIKESIGKFGEDISRGVTSPATIRLFDVTEEAEEFTEEKDATFHSTAEKLLWTMKRSRPDIATSIYFLCTQVKDLVMNDSLKLR